MLRPQLVRVGQKIYEIISSCWAKDIWKTDKDMHTQVIIHSKNKGILIKATGFPLSKRPPVLISAAIYQKRLCFCKFCLISPSANQKCVFGAKSIYKNATKTK